LFFFFQGALPLPLNKLHGEDEDFERLFSFLPQERLSLFSPLERFLLVCFFRGRSPSCAEIAPLMIFFLDFFTPKTVFSQRPHSSLSDKYEHSPPPSFALVPFFLT